MNSSILTKWLSTARYPGLLMFTVLVASSLAGCSSPLPVEMRNAAAESPGVAEVRHRPEGYVSSQVRWGGIILNTENRDKTSWLTILALPLDNNGRPRSSLSSPGRFIAVVDSFLEPLLYSRDRQITISGRVQGKHVQMVGEFPYEYPLVAVDHLHLWPKPVQNNTPYYPYLWPHYRWYHPLHKPRYPYQLVPHHR